MSANGRETEVAFIEAKERLRTALLETNIEDPVQHYRNIEQLIDAHPGLLQETYQYHSRLLDKEWEGSLLHFVGDLIDRSFNKEDRNEDDRERIAILRNIARIMVSKEHDVDALSLHDQTTPFLYAAAGNCFPMISILLELGADINKPNGPTGYTALHMAAQMSSIETVRFLAERDDIEIDASVAGNDGTPLFWATRFKRHDVMHCLVENGADIAYRNEYGNTLLTQVIQFSDDNLATVEYVIELLAREGKLEDALNRGNQFGITPTATAIFSNRIDVLRLLIAKGANVAQADIEGDTPLHVAACQGHVPLLELLLQTLIAAGGNKAELVNLPNKKGASLLHVAVYGALYDSNSTDMLAFLIREGANIHQIDHQGNKPIQVAGRFGHMTKVEFLLAQENNIAQDTLTTDGRAREFIDNSRKCRNIWTMFQLPVEPDAETVVSDEQANTPEASTVDNYFRWLRSPDVMIEERLLDQVVETFYSTTTAKK